jgi:hypothetical protein
VLTIFSDLPKATPSQAVRAVAMTNSMKAT